MTLEERAEFERQLYAFRAAMSRDEAHNIRCDLIVWVERYTTKQCADVVSRAFAHAERVQAADKRQRADISIRL